MILTLTAEQRAALSLAATGRSTAEVAAHLGISRTEARAHLAEAVMALGAGSKLEAVIIALRRGLLDVGEP